MDQLDNRQNEGLDGLGTVKQHPELKDEGNDTRFNNTVEEQTFGGIPTYPQASGKSNDEDLESSLRESNSAEAKQNTTGYSSPQPEANLEASEDQEALQGSNALGTVDSIEPNYPGDDLADVAGDFGLGHQGDEAGDSSSHNEADDIFSPSSPRSLLSSPEPRSGVSSSDKGDDTTFEDHSDSRRISNISQYDREILTAPPPRSTPRIPFRTPSSIHEMQMSSPPASLYNSPLSNKRCPPPAISRLGSPAARTRIQYSPKGRSTPPRLKSQNNEAAPLVLLHVTLLPPRWTWGPVLHSADPQCLVGGLRLLRDAWHQVQDRMGDTVLERGVLIPHPQNDYEILEERLLEALDLPLRHRARILECGHYIGPANERSFSGVVSDSEGDEDGLSGSTNCESGYTHWCTTCKSNIRHDALGARKVFRIKVYASNGLMRSGAWEACWKEMERVDVEIEPLVDPVLQDELSHLAIQLKSAEVEESPVSDEMHSPKTSFQPEATVTGAFETIQGDTEYHEKDRQRRDEERLREIYGHTPPSSCRRHSSFLSTAVQLNHVECPPPPPVPASVTEELPAHQEDLPEEEIHDQPEFHGTVRQDATLPELFVQASRILLRDGKNIAIMILSIIVVLIAVQRSSQPSPMPGPLLSTPTIQPTDVWLAHESSPGDMTPTGMDPCVSVNVGQAQAPSSGFAGLDEMSIVTTTVTETLHVTVLGPESPIQSNEGATGEQVNKNNTSQETQADVNRE